MLRRQLVQTRHSKRLLVPPSPLLCTPQAGTASPALSSRSHYYSTRSRLLTPSIMSLGSTGSSSIKKTSPLQTTESKWVGLQSIQWIDPTGKERHWESADRKTRKGEADAVAICCLITRPSTRNDPDLLLVSQFRPPVKVSGGETTSGLVIEMPAGLIDAGEEGKEGTQRAAMRELAEETGYGSADNLKNGSEQLNVLTTSPVMFNDPGMTGSNMRLSCIHIHLEKDDSPDPIAKPDEGEFIEKRLVKFNGLYDELCRLQEEEKYAVDARLYHFAWGAKLSGMVGNLAGSGSDKGKI